MTARDCLKMIREGVIDCRTAGSAVNKRNICRRRFCETTTPKWEPILRDRANKRRRDFVNDAAAGEIACGFGH